MFNQQLIGDEVRYNHDACGDSKQRLYVKRTHKGYVWHCFNCGKSGFKGTKENTLDDTRKYLNAKYKGTDHQSSGSLINDNLSLPDDYSPDINNLFARLWLDKYDITASEITKYHLGWSERLKRLILPLYDREGTLIFWQGRNCGKVTKENPKYINMRGSKDSYAVFNSSIADGGSDGHKERCLCLVEDILSAIKASRSTNAIPICGSYINTKLLQEVKKYDNIYLWLDFDKRFESLKYSSRIRLVTGKVCKTIITELDPKEYSDEEIRSYL